MLGGAIAGRALGDAGRRALPTEQEGPRPQAVPKAAAAMARHDAPVMRPTKP